MHTALTSLHGFYVDLFISLGGLLTCVYANRTIGGWNMFLGRRPPRFFCYLLVASVASLYSVVLGYNVVTSIYIFTSVTLGYMIFRQPGPDAAFVAGDPRPRSRLPSNKLVIYLTEKVFGLPRHTYVYGSPDSIRKIGLVAGAIRGLYVLPLSLALSYIWTYSVSFCFLGLFYGVSYWIGGQFKGDLIAKAEVIQGVFIVYPVVFLPIYLGSLSLT